MSNPVSTDSPTIQFCLDPRVSVVVSCKGRLDHLRETLPTMLAQDCPYDYEIVVVDYGCPQNTFTWCGCHGDQRLVCVRVLDHTDVFNLSRARNCGAHVASGDILAFVDADVRMAPEWLADACRPILAGSADFCTRDQRHPAGGVLGTWLVKAHLFHRVRGYDEGFTGWGGEDKDIYQRCAAVGRGATHRSSLLNPIRHGNDQRTMFYTDKAVHVSRKQNRAHSKRRGQVNPNGYGIGVMTVNAGGGAGGGGGQATITFDGPAKRIRQPIRRQR